jgi:acetylornithine deacetylase/succinyl-diaminopimelate desuccinylase-like protein
MRALAIAVLCSSVLVAQAPVDPSHQPAVSAHETLAAALLKQLVDINTTDSTGSTTAAAEAVAARLKTAGFPAADVQVLGPNPRKSNLVARFRGTGGRRPLLLLAHLDVVEARRDDWSVDPFSLIEKDGYYYGRGTSDDKGMAAQWVANLIRLKQEGFHPDRDLILALTADEEGGDFNGVSWLLEHQRPLIDAEFAINEGGSGVSKNGKYLVNEVQAAEKVYQDFRLEVRNAGGHSSLPVKDNAIGRLAAGLSRLVADDFPVRLSQITRQYFERSAAVQDDPRIRADMQAVAGTSPDAATIARLASASPYYNAMLRTTCVPTLLDGGHAENALPQTARATINCRILPDEKPADVQQALVRAVADPLIEVAPLAAPTPSPPSLLVPQLRSALESIVRNMWGVVPIVPVMETGATDGLYLRNAGMPVYGVTGIGYDPDDVRAHGKDERILVRSFDEGVQFIQRLAQAIGRPVP